MTQVTFDPAAFRVQFSPKWQNANCPTDAVLQAWFDTACNFISPDLGCESFGLSDAQRSLALYLCTAHIGAMMDAATRGQPLAMLTAATVSKVSVTAKAPPIGDHSMFQYWLALTPYGVQILAMLSTLAAGGFYFGGSPERAAYRDLAGNFGGVWPGRRW
jgi:hypothetical protein